MYFTMPQVAQMLGTSSHHAGLSSYIMVPLVNWPAVVVLHLYPKSSAIFSPVGVSLIVSVLHIMHNDTVELN